MKTIPNARWLESMENKGLSDKEKWANLLTSALEDYRKNHPNSPASVQEILNGLMGFYEKSSLIKRENGKYVLPEIY